MNTFGAGPAQLCVLMNVENIGSGCEDESSRILLATISRTHTSATVECCKYVCEFVRNYPRCAANVSVAPAYIGLGHMVRCYTVTRPLGLGYSL